VDKVRKIATWKCVVISLGMVVACVIAVIYRFLTTGHFFLKDEEKK